ncbi:hypothetical protein P3T76_003260 [Phytophthora citrophthora]|uniref:Uncharacterized protein n=1 Tax=Phytophthora citrophthora TaxID=4793 RepID=A0AAD9GU79_9STRA|nr:hypothetical protein P3T76_003260 [Phytophthora citrophthora]
MSEEETPIRIPERKKSRMQKDMPYASSTLSSEKLRVLVQLDESYSISGWAGHKWETIETQMNKSFAGLAVKRKRLISICSQVRKKQEIQELVRFKEQYGECQTTISHLQEEVHHERENAKQAIQDKEILNAMSEQWRVKSEKLAEELQLSKKETAEAEKRAKKQSKQDAKTKEGLEAQVKSWKCKCEITNALLKKEKETSEFLREAVHQD